MKKKTKMDGFLEIVLMIGIVILCAGVIAGVVLTLQNSGKSSNLKVNVKFVDPTTITVEIPKSTQNDYYAQDVKNLSFAVDGVTVMGVDPKTGVTYNITVSEGKHDFELRVGLLNDEVVVHKRSNFAYKW